MKKLQLYILEGTVKALVPAFLTLVTIMAVGFCLQLLHEGLDVVRLGSLLPSLFYYCVPMVLPSAFLTAVIITFGRLSADNELMAVQAAGVNLFRLIHPVLGLALVLSVVAAFLQFELLPRARGDLKALKLRALQQILLDKVALSANRDFSFKAESGRVLIKYDDFKDGQMVNLLAMMVEGDRPTLIIRAATCTIRPDPERPQQAVLFDMKDCVVTSLGPGQYRQRGSMTAPRGSITVVVASEPADVLANEKHMGIRDLIAYARNLRSSIAHHGRLFENPAEMVRTVAPALRKKNTDILDLDRVLDPLSKEYQKYSVDEPRLAQQVLADGTDRVAKLKEQVDSLRQQLTQVQEEIRQQGGEPADYDRLTKLQTRSKELLGQIGTASNEKQDLEEKTNAAKLRKDECAARADELSGKMRELTNAKAKLVKDKGVLATVHRWATQQLALRDVMLRIHKRLAQAFSIFVFALLGIPIGILAGGRNVMVAFGISFAIVLLVFYPLLIFGQVAAEANSVPVTPAIWAGDGLTFVIGLLLTARVVRS
jgi:lipopolysaccharide export LptBFGC system permease protein LptF